MPTDNNETFQLEDIQVDTLGLVSRGANQEDFFLLKEDHDDQSQATNFAEVEEKVTKNVWQKLIGIFKKSTAEELAKEFEVSTEEIQEEPVNTETVKAVEGEAAMPEDTVSKSEFEKAQNELAEIKKQLEAAKLEKEEMVWLNKATGFGYAPVATAELGKHLYSIAKLDEKEAAWLVDLLKAYDNLLEDSGLFVDKGSSLVPPDEIEKAAKSANPREELLKVDRKTGAEYLKQMRDLARR